MAEGIAIRDVLELPALAGARVVGGANGLDRQVRQVNVMEVPDILDWVTPDELLLTTAYPLRDDPVALASLVPRLAEKGLAGIAIKPTRYIGHIPQDMLDAADRLGFPLLELPPRTSFNEVITEILSSILDRQAARLQRSAAIRDRFMAIVLSGGGLPRIAEALAESVGWPVLIVDPTGHLLARSAKSEAYLGAALPPGTVVAVQDLERADRGIQPASVDIAGRSVPASVQPIRAGSERYGAVIVLAVASAISGDDLEALEYSATVAALRQVQARVVAEADRRFQTVCLEELVTGHITDRGVVLEWAVEFGWDLSSPRAVLVAEVDSAAVADASRREHEGATIRHRLAEAARLSLVRGAIVWERSRDVAALLVAGARGDAAHEAAAADLQAEVARRVPGALVTVGIGRVVDDPLRLRDSFAEARHARAVVRWTHGPGSIGRFEALGLDRLMASTPESERRAFLSTAIGPLLAQDERHGTALVATLERWLADRNGAAAARDLFIHYNTLKNRLDRIEALIGPFLGDPARCLELALAVRLLRLGRGAPPPERDQPTSPRS
jgi:purine catabolism regulator